jgi:hypothetical protein
MSEHIVDLGVHTDPIPLLARVKPGDRLRIRCPRPVTPAQQNYLLLFEHLSPVIEYTEEVWGEGDYDVERLAIPTEPILAMTGEFLQSLCDYSVLNREKTTENYVCASFACPPERQLLTDEKWGGEVFEAKSLFIYPVYDKSTLHSVFSKSWPNLRLIIFHNSDYPVEYKPITQFLESHPAVCVWAENSIIPHPRIRCVPIGLPNRIWRGGSLDTDPPITISRREDRPIEICMAHWGPTHPVRFAWLQQAEGKPLYRAPKLEKEEYLEFLTSCRALLCPQGNGVDTHRVWECLTKGVWAIVQDNSHTQVLLEQNPSLHLLPIDDLDDLKNLTVPPSPAPFHPLILREYWRILFAAATLL